MSSLIWFQLADETGNPYNGTKPTFVEHTTGSIFLVAHFREGVKSNYANKLSSVDSNQLLVYENRAALDKKTALTSSSSLTGLGTDDRDNAVIVVVPSFTVAHIVTTKKRRFVTENFVNELPLIDISPDYVTLPKIYLEKSGLVSNDDLVLYCRSATREQFTFLDERVIGSNVRGMIIGPPGTGKSVSTLAFMASLNREEWQVIWIHLGILNTCLVLNRRQRGYIVLDDYLLPSRGSRKQFVCIDGYKMKESHEKFYNLVNCQLCDQDRIVVCSSMGSLGKRNWEDFTALRIEVLRVSSWTREEYLDAVSNDTFYKAVKTNLDSLPILADKLKDVVNEEGNAIVDALQVPSEELKKNVNEEDNAHVNVPNGVTENIRRALMAKFFFAGGSCRFMFQYSTKSVIERLLESVKWAKNKQDLLKYCTGEYHADEINDLYGMSLSGEQFAVSSYVTSLFAKESGPEVARQLNTQSNP
jgi:hypothetical protein